MGLLAFEEGYVERMWGGQKLRTVYGKQTPGNAPIGEAWMIADHPQHISVVAHGPEAGRTLRELLEENAPRILGTRAQLTIHDRFPLLLKLLDAGDKLSIQGHPDDAAAQRIGEPDVGKTEMWYVLQGDPGSELYCGMPPTVTRADFEATLKTGTLADLLTRFPASEDTAVFVQAGTVHAIGGGSLLAEIQQNSDITYRVDDWGRVQDDGTPRELHVDKALEVTHFGSAHAGPAKPLAYATDNAEVQVLAACEYFAAELVTLNGTYTAETRGESFHLLLGRSGDLGVTAPKDNQTLKPGSALMIPGRAQSFAVEGTGSFLRYYVPDRIRDIELPLINAGHPRGPIAALSGTTA